MRLQSQENELSISSIVVKFVGDDVAKWNELSEATQFSSAKLLAAIAAQVHEPELEEELRALLSGEASSDDEVSKTVASQLMSEDVEAINARIRELGGSSRSRGKVLTYIARKAFQEMLPQE